MFKPPTAAVSLLLACCPAGCALDNRLAGAVGAPPGDTGAEGAVSEGCDPVEPAWALDASWAKRLDLSVPFGGVVVGPLSVGGPPAVVVATAGSGLTTYDGVDGSELWHHGLGQTTEVAVPALGDLDGDGAPDIVVPSDAGILAFHGDGSRLWTAAAPGGSKPSCGAAGIADLDGDGTPEVYFGRLILDGQTGAERAEGGSGWGTSTPGDASISVAADLDGDGRQEIVVGNAAYDADGNTLWGGDQDDGYPAVADLDDDGRQDILVARAKAFVRLDAQGGEVWSLDLDGGGPPAVADFDGDGAREIAVPFANRVVLLDAAGAQLWSHRTNSTPYWTNGVTAFDVDGDGAAEVLLTSEDGVEVLDGRTGDVRAATSASSPYCAQGPLVADVDGDGGADLVYVSAEVDRAHVRVLRDTAGFRRAGTIWNQHGFSITASTTSGAVPPHPDPSTTFRAADCD